MSPATGPKNTRPKEAIAESNANWLAVMRATHEYLSLEKRQKQLPKESTFISQVKVQEEWIKERLNTITEGKGSEMDIETTQHFVKTAPASNDPNSNMGGPRE